MALQVLPSGGMRAGFNLIEVLVAVGILAAVFVPVFGVFRSGVRTTKYTEDRLRALTIAQQQIEAIRHGATINRRSLEMVVREHLASNGFEKYTVDGRYEVTTEVDPDWVVEEGGTEAHVVRVRVLVSWKMGKDARTLSLVTYLDRAY